VLNALVVTDPLAGSPVPPPNCPPLNWVFAQLEDAQDKLDALPELIVPGEADMLGEQGFGGPLKVTVTVVFKPGPVN